MMYEYKAVHRETGGISSDTVQIDAVPSFLLEMDQQGYTVIALKKIGGVPGVLSTLLKRSKPRLVDKGMAFLELAAFLKAGIPLKNALRQLASEANPVLSKAFDLAVRSLDKGTDFHEALAAQPGLTEPWEIEAIRAAEVSGSLAECLDYLGNQALKAADFQSKVRSAMIYPVLVVCVTIGVVVVLVVFVMPTLT
ncbi:MAG TPA: hypothetical protein GXX40_09525 [Firmicutes bacterium]|nr:hypothetical protein [Bacillota bacterium]